VIRTDHPRIDPRALNKAVLDEHIAEFRTAVRRDANDETAHYGLGVAYYNLGLLEDAAEELTQSARLVPENPNVQAQLAAVLAQLARDGDKEAERAAWARVNRALLLEPRHGEALLVKAELHLRRREWLDAVGAWQAVVANTPEAAREPIARFLRDHAPVFLRHPRWSPPTHRFGDGTSWQRSPRTRRFGGSRIAAAVIVVVCVILMVLMRSAPTLALVAGGLILAVAFAPSAWRSIERAQAAGRIRFAGRARPSDSEEREKIRWLRGEVADVGQLLDAAEWVAAALQRADLSRDVEEQRKAAAREAQSKLQPIARTRTAGPGSWLLGACLVLLAALILICVAVVSLIP
jgi:tetratricopeptide (TPR) repeat protein